jgi:hypothetical protein
MASVSSKGRGRKRTRLTLSESKKNEWSQFDDLITKLESSTKELAKGKEDAKWTDECAKRKRRLQAIVDQMKRLEKTNRDSLYWNDSVQSFSSKSWYTELKENDRKTIDSLLKHTVCVEREAEVDEGYDGERIDRYTCELRMTRYLSDSLAESSPKQELRIEYEFVLQHPREGRDYSSQGRLKFVGKRPIDPTQNIVQYLQLPIPKDAFADLLNTLLLPRSDDDDAGIYDHITEDLLETIYSVIDKHPLSS